MKVVIQEPEEDEGRALRAVEETDFSKLPAGVSFESLACFSSVEGQD